MKKSKKLRRILAMFLTVVMMTQNVQVLMAGTTTEELDARTAGSAAEQVQEEQPGDTQVDTRANGEEYSNQGGDQSGDVGGTPDTGNDNLVTDGISNGDTAGDGNSIANNLYSNITQQIYQQEINGSLYNFVQLTAEVTNNDTANDAAGVDVKILLPGQLTYVANNETGGMSGFSSCAEAVSYGYSMADVPESVQASYGQALMWCGQTIGAGQTAVYTVSAQIADGITDVSGINPAWYVGGAACSGSWQNTDLLVPVVPEEPEVTEEPEVPVEPEEPVTPEVTVEPEVTEAPEVTETPEVTEDPTEPEVTVTPEVTEAPTEPEITGAPEEEDTEDEEADTEDDEEVELTEEQKEILRKINQRKPFAFMSLSEANGVEEAPVAFGEDGNSKMTGFDDTVTEYSNLENFLEIPVLKIVDQDGNEDINYDPNDINASGKKFDLTLNFGESSSNQMNNTPNLVYNLPAALKISQDIEPTALAWNADMSQAIKDTYGAPGFYKVDAASNKLYVQMNPAFVKAYSSVKANVQLWGEFHRTSSQNETIKIGDIEFKLKFDGNPLEASKGVSSYDKDKGFTFTIDVTSYGEPKSVNVTDTMGSNLELVPGTVKVKVGGSTIDVTSTDTSQRPYVTNVNEETNTFIIGLKDEWLEASTTAATTVQIEYQAKIKDMTPGAGSISGLNNTAVIQEEEKTDSRIVTANGSYQVEWIRKATGVLQDDDTVKWSLYVNEGAKADVTGLTISDTLKGSGQHYDTSRPIIITPKDGSSLIEIKWSDPALKHGYNAGGEEYWSYKLPDTLGGYKEYQFTYYTLVASGLAGTEYGNVGTVSKGEDSVSTGTIYGSGTGTGTGEGVISKKYEDKITIDSISYAKWKATIHVPAKGLTNVAFTDQLTGDHEFPEPLEAGANAPKIQCSGYNGTLNITRNSSTKMTILFGDSVEESTLPGADNPYDVEITYYTLLTKTEGQIMNTASVTSVEKNGFTDAKEELKEYSFGKLGSVNADDSQLLDWTLILSSNLEIDPSHPLVISDVLGGSGSHTYKVGSAKLLGWKSEAEINKGTFLNYSPFLNSPTNGSSPLSFSVNNPLPSGYVWTINYQTEIGRGSTGTTFTNNASFSQNNKNIGDASASVDTSATFVTKLLSDAPSIGNSYRATFQVDVDGSSLDIGATQAHTYVIKDYSDTSVNIQESTIKVTNKNNPSEKVSFGYTYEKNQTKDGAQVNVLMITIPATGKQAYTLTYEALIIPDDNYQTDGSGNLVYHNWAEFETHTVESTNEVEIKAGSSGSAGADNKYVYILKKERSTNTPLSGVGFKLSHWNNGNWVEVSNEVKTNASGIAGFGTCVTGKMECTQLLNDQDLIAGDVYKFVETTIPAGYRQLDEYIFVYGEKDENKSSGYNGYDDLTLVTNTGEIVLENECITEVQVEKEWEASDNNHPASVTVTLKASVNGTAINISTLGSLLPSGFSADKTLDSSNSWKAVWADLPKYNANAQEITYTVKESPLTGYQPIITTIDTAAHLVKYKINNYKVQENTSLKVEKKWVDLNNADGVRPDSLKVQLYQKVKGTETETAVSTINYTYNEVDSNGKVTQKTVEIKGLIDLNSGNNWTYEWPVLQAKTADGKELIWSVKEMTTSDGGNQYTAVEKNGTVYGKEKKTYTLTNIEYSADDKTTTLTNTYDWEKVDIPVKKIWDDKGDSSAASKIPNEITVRLIATVNKTEITDLTELSAIAGTTITDIKLNADTKPAWTGGWTGLAKYQTNTDGTKYEIQYSVKETTTLSNGWTNTETAKQSDGTWQITNTFTDTTSVSAVKKWDDNQNQDNKRPKSVTFTLYRPKLTANGTVDTDTSAMDKTAGEIEVEGTVYQPYAATGDTAAKVSTGTSTAEQWDKVQWNNLEPKWGYVAGTAASIADTKIPYIVRETLVTYADGTSKAAADGYEAPTYTVSDNNQYAFTFTNKHTTETKEIQVTKKWEDNNDQDALRPASITVSLKAEVNVNGTDTDVTVHIPELNTAEKYTKTITPSDSTVKPGDAGWAAAAWTTAKWENLPVYYQGAKITYSVSEAAVQGYTPTIPALTEKSAGVWTVEITNTHTPGETSFTATKTWNDDSNRDGIRPTQVAFQLYQSVSTTTGTLESAVSVDGEGKSGWVILDSTDKSILDNWTVTWTKLPQKQNGSTIHYFVKETNLTDKTEATSKDVNGYTISYSEKGDAVTNTWNPVLVSKTATKIWDDANDVEKLRPQSITMTLKASVALSTGDKELKVEYYDAATNTFKEDATKTTVQLQADALGNWPVHTWENLPKNYRYGGTTYTINYSVEETAVPSYLAPVYTTTTDRNFVVTNTYVPETKELKATKIWDDNMNSDGKRPDSIQLQLKADGETYYVTYEKKLGADGKWDGTSWEEVKHDIPVTTVTPEKSTDPNVDDIWKANWKDLPVYRLDADGNKQLIVYTLEELPLNGSDYDTPSIQISATDANLFEVTNHRETTKISKQLVKYWRDDNTDTTRPESVEFGLYMSVYTGEKNADGTLKYTDLLRVDNEAFKAVDTKNTLLPQLTDTIKNAVKDVKMPAKDAGDMVTCTWANLPKSFNGEAIHYEIKEENVPEGYQNYSEDTEDHTSIFNVTTSVEVSKVDLSDKKEIADAELRIVDPALAETAEGYVVASWKSSGNKHTVAGLTAGKEYILQETKAPAGYLKAEDVKFTVNKDGSVTKVVMEDAPTEVKVSKKTLTGSSELPGAVLQILDSTGNVAVTAGGEKTEWTTTTEQRVWNGLKTGTYTLHEKTAPDGYLIAKDITFVLQDSGKITVQNTETQVLEMRDAPTVIKILKTDENGKGLKDATLVVKDSTGKEIDRWVSDGTAHTIQGVLRVGAEYTLSETNAPAGYTLAEDMKFTVENKELIELSMKNYPADGSGSITVTKKLTYIDDNFDEHELFAKDDTFYVNLFTDKEGTKPYQNSAPKAIRLVNTSTNTVTFNDLRDGNYYVFETTADGTAIPMDTEQKDGEDKYMCTVESGSNHVDLDLEAGEKAGYVNLKNVYYDLPDGHFYNAKLSINKKVLKGTTQTTVNDTFYAGVFTKDADGVYNLFTVVQLKQNDTVTVEVPLGGENGDQPITYYVLETDEQGDIVDLDVFAYQVSGEGTVSFDTENTTGQINIVNKVPESQKGKLIVQKIDGGGIGLAGASFEITDTTGTVVSEWTSQASAQEIVLKPGNYTLTELKAPSGYTGAGTIAVTVGDDYSITVNGSVEYSFSGNVLKYVNRATTITPTPSGGSGGGGGGSSTYTSSGNGVNTLSGKAAVKTGDDTPIAMYVILLLLAICALSGIVVYRKKKK